MTRCGCCGRQWQLGEFDGDDAGSPISAAYVTRQVPLASWHPPGAAPEPYDGSRPLEALVESDGAPLPWPEKVAAGLRLSRALRRAKLDPAQLIATHPLSAPDPAVDPDADSDAHATSSVTPAEVAAVGAVFAARVPDADAVATAFDTTLEALVTAAGGGAARAVLAGVAGMVVLAPAAGLKRVATAGAQLLADCRDGRSGAAGVRSRPVRRWHAGLVRVRRRAGAGAGGRARARARARARGICHPGRIWHRGRAHPGHPCRARRGHLSRLPGRRYWQLEDAGTDLGAIDTYPTELGKLLLSEFTACFSGDWFRLPVRVPYGSAVRVEALVSTDTFGVQTLIPASTATTGPRPWRMYEHAPLAGATADGTWLLVPPVLAPALESAPVEDVILVRDPAADLAWGIENIVTNAVGRPVRRSEDLRAQDRVPDPDPREGLPDSWIWRLETSVPENWIPFLPTPGRADDDDYLLVQGSMLRYTRTADGALNAVPILPASLALRPGGTIAEREIPREGVSLQRTRRLARWTDGSASQWWARRRRPATARPRAACHTTGCTDRAMIGTRWRSSSGRPFRSVWLRCAT